MTDCIRRSGIEAPGAPLYDVFLLAIDHVTSIELEVSRGERFDMRSRGLRVNARDMLSTHKGVIPWNGKSHDLLFHPFVQHIGQRFQSFLPR